MRRRDPLGMAADSPPAPAISADRGAQLRDAASKYGLIVALALLPAYLAVHDLSQDGDLSRLGNNLVDGLSNGAIYALIAMGYTLVYGIIELINFAHGEVFMIGSFVSFGLVGTIGLPVAIRPLGLLGWPRGVLEVGMMRCGS